MVEFPLAPLPENEPPPRRKARRTLRAALRAAAAAFAVAAALFALLAIRLAKGIPERWTGRLGEAISTDAVDIEPAHVSFSLARLSLRVGSLGVYRKGEVREPIVRAAGIEVGFLPRSLMPSPAWLSSVRLDSLELGIDLSGGPEEEEEDSAAPEIPDLPPVPVRCGRVDVLGFRARNVEASLSCTGGVLHVEGARLSFPEEKVPGQSVSGAVHVALDPFAISVECAGRLDPNIAVPVLRLAEEEGVAAELERFAFADAAPELGAVYRYAPGRNERVLRIRVDSGPASYNGVPVDSFSGVVTVGEPRSWSFLDISQLSVTRPEGAASGALRLLPASDELSFSANATMDPVALAALIGILDADAELPVAFPAPAQIRASGTFAVGPGCTNGLSVSAFAPEVSVAGVPLRRASAELSLAGDGLRVGNVRADVLGGGLSASFGLVLPFDDTSPTNLPAQIDVSLDGLSFAQIAKLANPESPVDKGTVNARLSLRGPLDDITDLTFAETTGAMSIDAANSRVYRIPVFAGLTDILASFVPGVDWLVDEDDISVRGEFGRGRLRVDPFKIDGPAAGISGRGNVYFPECEVDLKVKVHLLNRSTWLGEGVYWLLSPLSKMFEIRATGPALSPRWTSATFQSNPSKK